MASVAVASSGSSAIFADSIDVAIPLEASRNYLTDLSWSNGERKPAETITLKVNSTGSARVFILAVDRAVDLLAKGGTKSASIDASSIRLALDNQQSLSKPARYDPKVCSPDSDFLALVHSVEGTVTATVDIETKANAPCPAPFPNRCGVVFEDNVMVAFAEAAPGGAQKRGGEGGSPVTAVKRVRTFFPETWIHEHVTLPENGSVVLPFQVPDSITSWRVAAFATHPQHGFSDGGQTEWLVVKKYVFVSLSLPPFVVRGEQPEIVLTVQNLLDEALTGVVLTVDLAEGLEAVAWPLGFVASSDTAGDGRVNISANSYWSGKLKLMPSKVSASPGLFVYFSAQTAASVGKADAVRRMLLVKPSGKPEELSMGKLLNNHSGQVNFPLPPALATASEGSAVVSATLVGDILGSAMTNLDHLVRVPTGCGEQTMLGLAPNVYVGTYLQSGGRLGASMRSKIVKNINIGVQRELMYRHDSGGFSAFGESDDSASTWLTAYVLKVFSEATRFVTVDLDVVEAAGRWLTLQQNRDGSFKKVGRVIHEDMMGGVSGGIGLTAFVSAALSEADAVTGKDEFAASTSSAAAFLRAARVSDEKTYTKLLVLRARAAAGDISLSDAATEALSLRIGDYWPANIPGSDNSRLPASDVVAFRQPWEHRPVARDVETTGYGILILLGGNMAGEALTSAQWLVSKQNGEGGFVSTQDTVVGLESLAGVASALSGQSSVTCDVLHEAGGEMLSLGTLRVTPNNFDVVQRIDLPNPERSSTVTFNCSGEGVAVATVASRWNTDTDLEPASFTLIQSWRPSEVMVDGRRLVESDSSALMNITSCAAAAQELDSLDGYHVYRIGLFSGYSADAATCGSSSEGLIKRVEPGDGYVDLYLDRFPEGHVCVSCLAERQHTVEELQPVRSEVFDYYNPSVRGGNAVAFRVAINESRDVSLPSSSRTSVSTRPTQDTTTSNVSHNLSTTSTTKFVSANTANRCRTRSIVRAWMWTFGLSSAQFMFFF
eukprot:TRINITY_DN20493_c0_g1_i2.p1 TRINITY_DN20493_c0_g1~~TRINITY_DN20493_c0_g1_i2.p1  ORF type:complete len:1003 (+),score=144.98 TRINITY_DN20493_c0_g1_i2:405-3413(+)